MSALLFWDRAFNRRNSSVCTFVYCRTSFRQKSLSLYSLIYKHLALFPLTILSINPYALSFVYDAKFSLVGEKTVRIKIFSSVLIVAKETTF